MRATIASSFIRTAQTCCGLSGTVSDPFPSWGPRGTERDRGALVHPHWGQYTAPMAEKRKHRLGGGSVTFTVL